jgi:cephalosporin hydroxylase
VSATVSRSEIGYDLLMKIQQGTMAYRYRGLPLQKNPFDLALFSLLLGQVRPRTLIEIGSYRGGSALWFADQGRALGLDLAIVSVDLDPPSADVPGARFVRGDARSLGSALPASFMASVARPLLVVEDASHLADTTAAVLAFFDPWLRSGEYMVIEDGILSDMRVADDYGGGPLRALDAFLERTDGRYEVDRTLCDYFGTNVTWNVNGYLRRLRDGAPT